MSTKTQTIGPTLKQAKISGSTLRSWEKLGLVPTPDRSSDGRRQYTEAQVAFICAFAQRRREEDPMKWRRPPR